MAGELFWRMSFLIGALHHPQLACLHFEEIPRPGDDAGASRPEREEHIQAIVTFMVAGLRAPGPYRRPSTR